MLEDIFNIADKLAAIAPKNQRDVIKVFKRSLIKQQLDTARIISDELVDYNKENSSDKNMVELSEALYDKTMEYYENNY